MFTLKEKGKYGKVNEMSDFSIKYPKKGKLMKTRSKYSLIAFVIGMTTLFALSTQLLNDANAEVTSIDPHMYEVAVRNCSCGSTQSATSDEACTKNATNCSGSTKTVCEQNHSKDGCDPEDSANLGDGDGDYTTKSVNCDATYQVWGCDWSFNLDTEDDLTDGTCERAGSFSSGTYSCGDKKVFQDCSE